MLVSPIRGVVALGGHECFCSEIRALAPEPEMRQTTALRVEFGFKEDTNRVSRREGKDKRARKNL